MKIGFFITSDGMGGAENATYNLVKTLSKNKSTKIYVFVNQDLYSSYKILNRADVYNLGKINRCNKFSILYSLILMSRKLKKIIRNMRLDILQVCLQDPITVSNWVKGDFRKITRIAGGDLDILVQSFKNKKSSFSSRNVNKCFNNSSKLICLSDWQQELLEDKYKSKSGVINNGIDTENFKPIPNIKQEKKVVLFAGRFIDWKGIKEILNVAKRLPQYEFWFAGQGPLSKEIKGKNIRKFGFQPKEKLVKLYNKATICIFPSWHEPFGNVAREAMACGRAVIVTPKGFSETITSEKDGIIIPAKDENALKNAIVDLMTNEKKRKQIEKNARKKALRYSWDKIADEYLKVFREAIKENENPSK